MSAPKKAVQRLVVLGASGFVGGHVAKEAIRRGLNVLCLSRKGKAPPCYAETDWARKAEWSTGDALDPETYRDKLDGASALVVSIGSPPLPFVDFNYQVRMNGDTNIIPVKEAKARKIPQVVLIGAAMPPITPKGYAEGKRMAEREAFKLVDASFGATVLKPGAIYGTRHTPGGTPIPLWLLMAPAARIARMMPSAIAANSPVSVEAVAAAAVDAATDAANVGRATVIDNVELCSRS